VKDPETKSWPFTSRDSGTRGREFVLPPASVSKPVVVLNPGRHRRKPGRVEPHGEFLAVTIKVFAEVLAQYGNQSRQETSWNWSPSAIPQLLFDLCGGKIGIITGSGGHGAMAVDLCTAHGLGVPQLSSAFHTTCVQGSRRV